jgi:hypothetical protein
VKPPRTYRMTVFSTWYDSVEEELVSYEMHYKITRRGRIRSIREQLRRRGMEHFQRSVYRLTKKWLPRRKVKAYFEREEPAKKSQRDINVEVLRMRRKDRRWKATKLPSRVIRLFRRRKR